MSTRKRRLTKRERHRLKHAKAVERYKALEVVGAMGGDFRLFCHHCGGQRYFVEDRCGLCGNPAYQQRQYVATPVAIRHHEERMAKMEKFKNHKPGTCWHCEHPRQHHAKAYNGRWTNGRGECRTPGEQCSCSRYTSKPQEYPF